MTDNQEPFADAALNQLRADYARRRRSLTFAETDAAQLLQAFASRRGVALEEVLLALLEQNGRAPALAATPTASSA